MVADNKKSLLFNILRIFSILKICLPEKYGRAFNYLCRKAELTLNHLAQAIYKITFTFAAL